MFADLEAEAGLWPEHLPALEAFLAVRSQWRMVARFGAPPLFVGLDYTAAESGLRMAGIAVTPELWTEVRLIEEGAIEALNGD
jgi:hypothetical protein